MAVSKTVAARASACGLFHISYSRVLKVDLLHLYIQLCRDEIATVREYAVKNLVKFAASLELEDCAMYILPMIESFSEVHLSIYISSLLSVKLNNL